MTGPRQHHILFVDDDSEIRGIVQKMFSRHGYLVTTVATGHEVLRLLDYMHVDALVVDLVLPHMNGLELLEQVHNAHPQLPCVLYTGVGFDERIFQEAKIKGALGFVSKSLPLSQLLLEINRLLNYRERLR